MCGMRPARLVPRGCMPASWASVPPAAATTVEPAAYHKRPGVEQSDCPGSVVRNPEGAGLFMKSWKSAAGARKSGGRLLPRAPNPLPDHGASCPRSRGSRGQKTYRRDMPSISYADSRNYTENPLVIPARSAWVSPRSETLRGWISLGSSVDSLHQLIPRALEGFPQTCSNRDSRLGAARFHPAGGRTCRSPQARKAALA